MTYKYALAIFPDEPRCLVNISSGYIGFNINGFMRFDTPEDAETFRQRWVGRHFYDVRKLTVVQIEDKEK